MFDLLTNCSTIQTTATFIVMKRFIYQLFRTINTVEIFKYFYDVAKSKFLNEDGLIYAAYGLSDFEYVFSFSFKRDSLWLLVMKEIFNF